MQVELSTLKNNNARLTSALQESTSNVEEWKRQLHNYKVVRNGIRSWRKENGNGKKMAGAGHIGFWKDKRQRLMEHAVMQ